MQTSANRRVSERYQWAADAVDGRSEMGVLHPRMHEATFAWAATHGLYAQLGFLPADETVMQRPRPAIG